MTFLIINGERYALPLGDTTLGGEEDELLCLSPLAALPPFAVMSSDGERSTIRALPGSLPVFVQEEPLGPDRRLLRHGDYLTVGSMVVHVGDLDKAGRTDGVSGVSDTELGRHAGLPSADPTAATGGRLKALSDGRTYEVPATGLVIGRDPDCDIVLPSLHVSRRHARVVPGILGYSLIDDSTNGIIINGASLEGQRVLGQGDIVGIGGEEFQFRADAASYEPDASVFAAPRVPLHASPPPAPDRATPPTEPVSIQRPSGPVNKPAPVLLATLEVLEGSLPAGTLFRIERPVVQIGRGARSDVHIADESVSAAHATLLQRDSAWQLLDLGSRNGTYVEGRRVSECVLQGVCELRLGMITLLFRPIRSITADTTGTIGLIGITDSHRRVKP